MNVAEVGRSTLFVVGVSYKTAPVELREQLVINPAQLACHACRLKLCGDFDEIVLLSTCNRMEIYGVTSGIKGWVDSLFRLAHDSQHDLRPHIYLHENIEAVRHLFRVASGLDSMALGETEIAGQTKHAYDLARAAGLTGGVLNRVFQKAFQAQKEVRAETGINLGATSIGSVAVELAAKIFPHDLSRQKVIIIGAGKMGEACVRHLAAKGVRSILVANRSIDRAIELARECGGQAVPFENWLTAMADADIVVVSTGCPRTLLHRAEVEAFMSRRDRPLFLIDISVPRNIDADVQLIDQVHLYNIDDLETIIRGNLRLREQDLGQCQRIIDSRATALMEKLNFKTKRAGDGVMQLPPSWTSPRAAVLAG